MGELVLELGLQTVVQVIPVRFHLLQTTWGNAQVAYTAKKICADCPVRDECLEYALANKEEGGIWGGLTHNQRVRLKKARAKGLSLV